MFIEPDKSSYEYRKHFISFVKSRYDAEFKHAGFWGEFYEIRTKEGFGPIEIKINYEKMPYVEMPGTFGIPEEVVIEAVNQHGYEILIKSSLTKFGAATILFEEYYQDWLAEIQRDLNSF